MPFAYIKAARLYHLSQVLKNVLSSILHTLFFEPFAAVYATDYLYLLQLCLLGFSRHDGGGLMTLLGNFLAESASAAHGATALVQATLERLVSILTRGDALEPTTGRMDRGKLTVTARDEAFEVLRCLRMEVRL